MLTTRIELQLNRINILFSEPLQCFLMHSNCNSCVSLLHFNILGSEAVRGRIHTRIRIYCGYSALKMYFNHTVMAHNL